VPYVNPGDWDEKYVNDTTFDDLNNGPLNFQLVRKCTFDTLGNDLWSGTAVVTQCVASNLAPFGGAHMDLWQESSAGAESNVILYRNRADTAAGCEGFFIRTSTDYVDFAVVENDWYLNAYPQQSQLLCKLDHMVWWHNSHTGTPVTFGFSDGALVEPLASANTLWSVRNNVFQWVQGVDPENYLGHAITTADFTAMGTWDNNHYYNTFDGGGAVGAGAITVGTNATTGASPPAGKGHTW
jgi:hypothetical protein